ncbi:MAG: hypothetical protein NUW12_05625 [Firmicutes bacterium]|nr:hypothetical protein [Bacillota bacterium]MDH7495547.1 hypothetical protein [Bacillota bacterium]
MRWAVIVLAFIPGIAALILILAMLPLKVSVRFVRTAGRNIIRVWVGVLSGLVWLSVYRSASRVEDTSGGEVTGVGEDLTSVLAEWVSRLWARSRALGGSGGARVQQGPRRWRDVRGRIGRFLFSALRSTGLDVKMLRIRVELGSGEAATSAIGVGLTYALVNACLAACPVPLRFAAGKPEIAITPRYDRAGLDVAVDCIVALTPGYIILQGIQNRRRRRRVSCPTTR